VRAYNWTKCTMQTPLTPVSTSGALEELAHLAPLMAPVLLNEAYI